MNKELKLMYIMILCNNWKPIEYKEDLTGGFVNLKGGFISLVGSSKGVFEDSSIVRYYLYRN